MKKLIESGGIDGYESSPGGDPSLGGDVLMLVGGADSYQSSGGGTTNATTCSKGGDYV